MLAPQRVLAQACRLCTTSHDEAPVLASKHLQTQPGFGCTPCSSPALHRNAPCTHKVTLEHGYSASTGTGGPVDAGIAQPSHGALPHVHLADEATSACPSASSQPVPCPPSQYTAPALPKALAAASCDACIGFVAVHYTALCRHFRTVRTHAASSSSPGDDNRGSMPSKLWHVIHDLHPEAQDVGAPSTSTGTSDDLDSALAQLQVPRPRTAATAAFSCLPPAYSARAPARHRRGFWRSWAGPSRACHRSFGDSVAHERVTSSLPCCRRTKHTSRRSARWRQRFAC